MRAVAVEPGGGRVWLSQGGTDTGLGIVIDPKGTYDDSPGSPTWFSSDDVYTALSVGPAARDRLVAAIDVTGGLVAGTIDPITTATATGCGSAPRPRRRCVRVARRRAAIAACRRIRSPASPTTPQRHDLVRAQEPRRGALAAIGQRLDVVDGVPGRRPRRRRSRRRG
ncbi:MAG: hypothetical protein U0470_13045 [Anaerolineae bacterium]